MGVYSGPDLKEDGLVLALDGANYKSFKGFAATNLLYSITNTYGEQPGANFKTSYGDEQVFIPMLGYKTVRYCNIYNNYPTSGDCCPSPLRYGGSVLGQTIAVSSSTTYTYQIIYKTTSGYTHPNFMYRYEFGASGYVTEGGVHSDSNRTSLGDGWYHAWGQFTTQSTTTYLWLTGMWYYQYGVYDKISIAGVSLHQGTFIISPEHMLLPQENRGTTVATGGGWADLIGNGNHGELLNGVREDSANGGSLVFDGTNDFISITKTSQFNFGTSDFAIETFCNLTSKSSSFPCIFSNYSSYGSGAIYFGYEHDAVLSKYSIHVNGTGVLSSSSNVTYNVWTHLTLVRSSGVLYFYINGVLNGTPLNMSSSLNGNGSLITIGKANDGSSSFTHGKIANFKIYNRALTASEIQQNFNATRSRFGI